ncbi:hypothetical protein LCGC14_2734810, partial [marine sediment metagenome]
EPPWFKLRRIYTEFPTFRRIEVDQQKLLELKEKSMGIGCAHEQRLGTLM